MTAATAVIVAAVLWAVALYLRWAYHRHDGEEWVYEMPNGDVLTFTGYPESMTDDWAFTWWEALSDESA